MEEMQIRHLVWMYERWEGPWLTFGSDEVEGRPDLFRRTAVVRLPGGRALVVALWKSAVR